MALANYGVLKGRAVARRRGSGRNPHYQLHVVADETHFRVSVNVKSVLRPSELLYLVIEGFEHPVLSALRELPLGFTKLASRAGGPALDYVRGALFDPAAMTPLSHREPGPDNDLNDKIDAIVKRAAATEVARVYAYGERWGPQKKRRDGYFHFRPGNGIHDVHMNQGSHPAFRAKDGVWQDGALLFEFPQPKSRAEDWAGVFLKFQSQTWRTDDRTGLALDAGESGA